MVVLVDAKYFGNILCWARKHQRMKTKDVAKIFHISVRQWHRYTDTNAEKNLFQKIF